jgi:hypothetical protein
MTLHLIYDEYIDVDEFIDDLVRHLEWNPDDRKRLRIALLEDD